MSFYVCYILGQNLLDKPLASLTFRFDDRSAIDHLPGAKIIAGTINAFLSFRMTDAIVTEPGRFARQSYSKRVQNGFKTGSDVLSLFENFVSSKLLDDAPEKSPGTDIKEPRCRHEVNGRDDQRNVTIKRRASHTENMRAMP